MFATLKLKFGRTTGIAPEVINLTPITIFVGPNNSGKSKVLAEIRKFCFHDNQQQIRYILDDISICPIAPADVDKTIEYVRRQPDPSETPRPNHVHIGSLREGHQWVPIEDLRRLLLNPRNNFHFYCQWFLKHTTLNLNGEERIRLVQPQPLGDLQAPPNSSLQALFCDDNKRAEVRRIIHEAFGVYFVLDPTNPKNLRIRLSRITPKDPMEERGLHAEAVRFHAAAQLIDQASDGVKAFTGIISELVAGDPKIVFIDEPEAFLHPSLANKLGFEISRSAQQSNKRVFVATHSSAFLMGCIQSGVPLNIIRLTYRDCVGTARVLPSDQLTTLMRHPLLRSSGVLTGLFYEFVVVTESDADRAFYQEINERLLNSNPALGIPNCLFINAQNKQTIHTIIRPLRQMGIPAAAIIDIDFFKEGGSPWSNMLTAANIPEITLSGLAPQRTKICDALKQTGKDMKRDGGISILQPNDRQAAETLLQQLSDYGVFIIPGGELESWLKPLGATGHGPEWLINIFEKMGADPNNKEYVRPDGQDVWSFMSKIRDWMINTKRKGIPS